jgi:hypothetical protein
MNEECSIYRESFHLNLGLKRGISSQKKSQNNALGRKAQASPAYSHVPGACEREVRCQVPHFMRQAPQCKFLGASFCALGAFVCHPVMKMHVSLPFWMFASM